MAVNKSGIYQLLENRLKATGETPLTCGELYEFAEIRELARDANRVSDYLGHMWRRGLIQRWCTTPKDLSQKARFAYTWKGEVEVAPMPASSQKIEKLNIIRSNYTKPNVTITEDDNSVVLDFEQFTITVQRKA